MSVRMIGKYSKLETTGLLLVFLMAVLQGFYAIYAYLDYSAFSNLRGTSLLAEADKDWVFIYASRTLFVALIIGYLLIAKNFKALMYAAMLGVVMPTTDGVLAYTSDASVAVIVKHGLTVIYLLVTFFVLKAIVKNREIA